MGWYQNLLEAEQKQTHCNAESKIQPSMYVYMSVYVRVEFLCVGAQTHYCCVDSKLGCIPWVDGRYRGPSEKFLQAEQLQTLGHCDCLKDCCERHGMVFGPLHQVLMFPVLDDDAV